MEVSLEEIEELVGELEEEILKRDTRLASLDQAADSPGSSSSLVGRIGRRIDLCLNEVGQMKTLRFLSLGSDPMEVTDALRAALPDCTVDTLYGVREGLPDNDGIPLSLL